MLENKVDYLLSKCFRFGANTWSFDLASLFSPASVLSFIEEIVAVESEFSNNNNTNNNNNNNNNNNCSYY